MDPIIPFNLTTCLVDLRRDGHMEPRAREPGPPQRIDGYSFGLATVDGPSPHGGERHPDGDELLIVLSGRALLTCESQPGIERVLGPGDACIVRRGVWHKLEVIEPYRLLHLTPGPQGHARPVGFVPPG